LTPGGGRELPPAPLPPPRRLRRPGAPEAVESAPAAALSTSVGQLTVVQVRYDGSTMTTQHSVAAHPGGRQRGGLVLVLVIILGVVLLVVAGYLALVLNWSYSEGERAGVLQKFSRKGWLCKTWEGELAMSTTPGVAPVIWSFSVRDDQVATELALATGKPVALHYEEHKGIPTNCFGETPFYVTSFRLEP
jgi:hypothetical protein